MALTKEEQAIIDNYNRAKAQQTAQRDIELKEAAERLALQQAQTAEVEKQAQTASRQTATGTYVAGQQAQRTLPNQLAQRGLSMSGYRSLAQQKMAREQTQAQGGIRSNLANSLAGYARSRQADQLSYDQSRRSTLNQYSQAIANLDLGKKQDLSKLPTSTTTQQQSTQDAFTTTVQKAYTGALTYDQFKAELAKYGLDSATVQAYLQNYLYYQATRGVQ
jgi:L-amino acid N-acyltransferase YncA